MGFLRIKRGRRLQDRRPCVFLIIGALSQNRQNSSLIGHCADSPNERVRIEFDGVYQDAGVWINGHPLGRHPYDYTPFGYDLTQHLRQGDNVISVEVKNEGANSRWYAGSGIYRHVRLIRTGAVNVPPWGVNITTPEVSASKAVVRLRTRVANESDKSADVRLRTSILTDDGRVIASAEAAKVVAAAGSDEFDQQLTVDAPALWSLDAPQLYTAATEVWIGGQVVDSVRERFGIRSISVDAREGFDHPWVIGDFIWTGWDYLGESSIGWIGFGYPVYWPVAYCGDIDITGVRRPQSYYRGALFGDDKVAAFVRRPEPLFSHTRRFDWGSDDVHASWTWPGHEGKNLTICVYSSCDEVELLLNGKSLGKRPTTRSQQFKADFGVPYQPGKLVAIGYKGGKAVSEWTLETAGKPAALRLQPERTALAADGKALALVPFEVVDAEGRLHPDASLLVRFTVDGPAVLAAVGNGDPSSLESFQQPQRKAWQGRGLVIIRSTGKPGRIRVTATSEGLTPATVNIEAR